jgi:hypothetical protein
MCVIGELYLWYSVTFSGDPLSPPILMPEWEGEFSREINRIPRLAAARRIGIMHFALHPLRGCVESTVIRSGIAGCGDRANCTAIRALPVDPRTRRRSEA